MISEERAKKLLEERYPRMWDCAGVKCPSCDAEVGRRCKPLGPPYKVRSTREEVDVPHVMRLRLWNGTQRMEL